MSHSGDRHQMILGFRCNEVIYEGDLESLQFVTQTWLVSEATGIASVCATGLLHYQDGAFGASL